MLKVLSLSSITINRKISIKKEIMDLLDINFGDEIWFILDNNGIVNIRKFKDDMILETEEKYISSAHLIQPIGAQISSDIRIAINADVGDRILWISDSKGNILIRNTVILDECSINIFNKDISALIIDLTTLNYNNFTTSIPKEITDILGLYEGIKLMLSLDEYDNIIVSKEMRENILEETLVSGRESHRIYFNKTVIDILDNTDKILWFFDEEGNVIIKNNLLPDNCVNS